MGFILNQENLQKLHTWLDSHPLGLDCHPVIDDIVNPDMSRHKEVVERILTAYHKSKEEWWDVGYEYMPNEMWNKSVQDIRSNFLDALRTGKGVGNFLQNFWRNECSEHLVKYAKYTDVLVHGKDAQDYFKYRALRDWDALQDFTDERDIKKLALPAVGNPYGCVVGETLITGASTHSYYYADKISALIQGIERPVVAEIGGGSGAMAYYLLKRNSSLRYLNFDLPEILAVSQYFLMMALPDRKFELYGEDVADFDIALLPNFCIATVEDNSCDVVANFHSLSEMSQEAVDNYSKQISRICRGYFYHENSVQQQDFNETPIYGFNPEGFCRIYTSPAIWGEPIYRENLHRKLI